MLKRLRTSLMCVIFLMASLNLSLAQNFETRDTHSVPFTVYSTSIDSLSFPALIDSQDLFEPVEKFPKKTNPSNTYWIRLDFKEELNHLKKDSIWYLRFRNFEYNTLFFREGQSIKNRDIGIFNSTHALNSIGSHIGSAFSLDNLINDRYLYLKVKRVRFFEPLSQWNFRYIDVTTDRRTNHDYYWPNIKKLIPAFLFAGICIIMIILTSFFYLFFRKKEYLFYALYVFCLLIYLSGTSLRIYDCIFNDDGFLSFWLYQSLQMLINICYVSFILYYLKTNSNYPKLHVAIIGILVFLSILLLLDTIFIFLEKYILHIHTMDLHRLVMILFGIGGMIYLIRHNKDKLAYFIVIGSFCYMVGALCHIFLGNHLFMLIGVSLEIIIFAFGLTYKMLQSQQEKLHFEKESFIHKNKALRAQINPHFIFNSLSSIQHLIASNNKVSALKYLTKFSRLIRTVLEGSIESNVLLSDEITMLNDYLELESLRFDGAFEYKINLDENIDPQAIEVPALIVQPFVENAIIHGLLNKKDDDKQLIISYRKEDNVLICEVEDNGIGRQSTSTKQTIHKSRGVAVTEERLKNLNQKDDETKHIEIIDKYDEFGNATGTKIIIKIQID